MPSGTGAALSRLCQKWDISQGAPVTGMANRWHNNTIKRLNPPNKSMKAFDKNETVTNKGRFNIENKIAQYID